MKGFFDTIPKELDESAKVDGATHVQIFFKVILPVARADPRRGVPALVPDDDERADLLAQNLLRGTEAATRWRSASPATSNAGFDNRFGPFAAGSLIVAAPGPAALLHLNRAASLCATAADGRLALNRLNSVGPSAR